MFYLDKELFEEHAEKFSVEKRIELMKETLRLLVKAIHDNAQEKSKLEKENN